MCKHQLTFWPLQIHGGFALFSQIVSRPLVASMVVFVNWILEIDIEKATKSNLLEKLEIEKLKIRRLPRQKKKKKKKNQKSHEIQLYLLFSLIENAFLYLYMKPVICSTNYMETVVNSCKWFPASIHYTDTQDKYPTPECNDGRCCVRLTFWPLQIHGGHALFSQVVSHPLVASMVVFVNWILEKDIDEAIKFSHLAKLEVEE